MAVDHQAGVGAEGLTNGPDPAQAQVGQWAIARRIERSEFHAAEPGRHRLAGRGGDVARLAAAGGAIDVGVERDRFGTGAAEPSPQRHAGGAGGEVAQRLLDAAPHGRM
ncbi:hypothetical protein B4N89_40600 [Embleya scabrispora]|uniref:Uncharacterized protein n=1 Tax=Embleya scabrispora TaxID=159449 RepID=A0A1T3NJ76_9ACTN|nr:hypothetical protein B4N89_40600 [Embleya scabrispora]